MTSSSRRRQRRPATGRSSASRTPPTTRRCSTRTIPSAVRCAIVRSTGSCWPSSVPRSSPIDRCVRAACPLRSPFERVASELSQNPPGRVGATASGDDAEGATTPESLRQPGPVGRGNAGKQSVSRSARRRGKPAIGVKLSGTDDSGGTNHRVPGGTRDQATQPNCFDDDDFVGRHIGPRPDDVERMLAVIGVASVDELIDQTVPSPIRLDGELALPAPRSEPDVMAELRELAAQNRPMTSMIGMGYHGTITPPVIRRNVLENPAWYTAYTPYQPEISQGRLEALLNFQTMVSELTGLDIANASLLDEATAAAEAMALAHRIARGAGSRFFVHHDTHPQTLAVLRHARRAGRYRAGDRRPRAARRPRAVRCAVQLPHVDRVDRRLDRRDRADPRTRRPGDRRHRSARVRRCSAHPATSGPTSRSGRRNGSVCRWATAAPTPGSSPCASRPHASLPGRLVGVSVDTAGRPALRLALQTREQHIRREKATSNICTAQVLLANIAGLYASWHGPGGLRRIAERVHTLTTIAGPTPAHRGFPDPPPDVVRHRHRRWRRRRRSRACRL